MNTKDIFQKNIEVIDLVNQMILLFRRQNFNRGDRIFPIWIQKFSALMGIFFEQKTYFNEYGVLIEETLVTQMLKEIMQAQEQKDYTLLADLLELRILPFFLSVQDVLRAKESDCLFDNSFETNLRYLQTVDPILAGILREQRNRMLSLKCENESDMILSYKDDKLLCSYELEQTSQGNPTLRMTDQKGSWYFHGNACPLDAARSFASTYYRTDRMGYCIYGLGLGYHVRALCEETCFAVPVTVFESDLNIIVLAMQMYDYSSLLQRNLKIVYDPDFHKFMEHIQNDSEPPVIHYPSLRNISYEAVKKRMEELFVQDSSIRNQLVEMLANFNSNILHCTHYVDELKSEITGKDVYLVAAGPSLDKNIELLKKKPKNAVIIVVGTAFRKLMNENIKPDYAVFLDSGSRVYGQVQNFDTKRVSCLIASTACKEIAQNYQGDCYLVCQNGFKEAQRYASEHGLNTYNTGGSVSTIAFDIAIGLGAKSVIVIGLDLAYTGNKIHASGADWRTLSEDATGLVEIKSFDGGTVRTTMAMEMYRLWFEKRIADANNALPKEHVPDFINATEGGAYIAGMKYRSLKEAIDNNEK